MGGGVIYGPADLSKTDNAGIAALKNIFSADVLLDAVKRLNTVRQDINQAVAVLDRTPVDRLAWLTFGISAMPLIHGEELAVVGERLLSDWQIAAQQWRACLISSGRVGHTSNTTRYVAVPEIDLVPVSAFREGGRKTALILELTPGILDNLGPQDHVVFLHAHCLLDTAGHKSKSHMTDSTRAAFPGPYRVLTKDLYTQRDVALKTLASYMGKTLSSRGLATSEWNGDPEATVPASHNLRKLEGTVLESGATLQIILVHSQDFVWTNIRSQAGRKKTDIQNHKLQETLLRKTRLLSDTYGNIAFGNKTPQSLSERVVKRHADNKDRWALEDWKKMAANRALTSADIRDVCARNFPTGWAEVNYIHEKAVMEAARTKEEETMKADFFGVSSVYKLIGSLAGNDQPYY